MYSMYATSDRQTDGQMTDADDRLMPPLYGAGALSGHALHNSIIRQTQTDTIPNLTVLLHRYFINTDKL